MEQGDVRIGFGIMAGQTSLWRTRNLYRTLSIME